MAVLCFSLVLHAAAPDPQRNARIAGFYASASRWDRFHVQHRLELCPYEALLPHLPVSGRVLDIGCGFGLLGQFLAETRPELAYVGTDVDPRKVELARRSFAARRAALPGGQEPQLFAGDVRAWTARPPSFSAVLLLDVLYVIPQALQQDLFDLACQVLESRPDAALLLKILPPLRGRARLRTFLQESIMIHLLRKTRSSGALFSTQDPALYAGWGRARGLFCEEIALPTHPPSVLLVLRKAPG